MRINLEDGIPSGEEEIHEYIQNLSADERRELINRLRTENMSLSVTNNDLAVRNRQLRQQRIEPHYYEQMANRYPFFSRTVNNRQTLDAGNAIKLLGKCIENLPRI